MEEFQITRSQAGFMSTLYFWFYAAGQLLAGWLCTRRDPKLVAGLGIFAASACNFVIGFLHSFPAFMVVWTINGLAQALFWPSILQIGTNWSEPEEYTRLSILLNLPTTVGFLIAWAGLGALHAVLPWQWMFWIPGTITLLFGLMWLGMLWSSPAGAGLDYRPAVTAAPPREIRSNGCFSLMQCLLTGTMMAYGLLVIFQGCTKESINLWAPTLLQDVSGGRSLVLVSAFTGLIPVFSTVGLLATGWLAHRSAPPPGNVKKKTKMKNDLR